MWCSARVSIFGENGHYDLLVVSSVYKGCKREAAGLGAEDFLMTGVGLGATGYGTSPELIGRCFEPPPESLCAWRNHNQFAVKRKRNDQFDVRNDVKSAAPGEAHHQVSQLGQITRAAAPSTSRARSCATTASRASASTRCVLALGRRAGQAEEVAAAIFSSLAVKFQDIADARRS